MQNLKKRRHSVINSMRIPKLFLSFPSIKTLCHIQVPRERSYINQERLKMYSIVVKYYILGKSECSNEFSYQETNKGYLGILIEYITNSRLRIFNFFFRFLLIMNFRTVCTMSLPPTSPLWGAGGEFKCSQPPRILGHDFPVPEDDFSAVIKLKNLTENVGLSP